VGASFPALGFAAALFCLAAPVSVAAGPFSDLNGAWSGNGTIKVVDGGNERIRCRINYAVGASGLTMQKDMRCASDSFRFDLRSDLKSSQDGWITGTWLETNRGVGGVLNGRAHPGRIDVHVESSQFSANLAVSTNGDRQSVTVRSPSTWITDISISLRRK
jgi:hypothetical protein